MTMTPIYESIEWDNTWMEQTENTAARRILYIGDSISVGTRSVANPMGAGKVVFDNVGSSKSLDNPVFFESLSLFASQQPSRAAVFFNNGLHGWHLTDEEYETLYAAMLDKLIGAYSDVPVFPLLSTFTTSPDSPVERVQARNEIVTRLAAARGLTVIDLYSVSKANAARLTDGVHFDVEGYNALAKTLLQVAESI